MGQFYKVYKYQADVLRQMTMTDGSRYNPVLDINGEYFITEKEHKHCGLGESAEYISPVIEETI